MSEHYRRARRTEPGSMRFWIGLAVMMSVVLAVSPMAKANLRLTMLVNDTHVEDVLIKDAQVIFAQGTGTRIIYHCELDEYTYISDDAEQYWQGTSERMISELRAGLAPLTALIEQIFGGELPQVALKFTQLDNESVADYDARHFLVEESDTQSGPWMPRAEIWVSEKLEGEIQAVSPSCINVGRQFVQLHDAFLSMIYSPEADDLDAYYDLMDGAFPVRTRIFAISDWEWRELVEMVPEPVASDLFTIPGHYERTRRIMPLLGPDLIHTGPPLGR